MTSLNILISLFILSFLISACGDKQAETSLSESKVIETSVDPIEYSQGQKLFQAVCSSCHGNDAQGAKDWRKPDKDGKNLAPPLNGTGHTWHHSNESLTNTIKNGTAKIGGNMPAWKNKLTDREIKLILLWIKAQWPDELYTAWYNRFHQK